MKKSQRLALAGLLLCFSLPASAAFLSLNVTYTNPTLVFGPLSLGLAALPEEVHATFTLDADVEVLEGDNFFSATQGDVLTGTISLGDATWTASLLASLAFNYDESANNVTTLNYNFNDVLNTRGDRSKTLNNSFSLTVEGTDFDSGQDFEYFWSGSAQTVSTVPIPATVWLFGSGLIGLMGMARKRLSPP